MKRRAILGATLASALLLVGCSSPAPSPTPSALPDAIQQIMDRTPHPSGAWGLQVVDLETGDLVYALNPDRRFITGSVAKIFSVTTALEELGLDYRFTTPVVATGPVTGGTVDGDLVLRASGDLTFGGRMLPSGELDVPIFDHYDANLLPGVATLTPEDPLVGLNSLAQQIAAAGVTRVNGNVLIDDRLWDPVTLDKVPITPISVNDNLIDFTVAPGASVGAPAMFAWRPQAATFSPTLDVTTGAADSPIDLEVVDAGNGNVKLRGSVPLGHDPIVWTYQVPDPATWARSLFIEALQRNGVAVNADPRAANQAGELPDAAVLDADSVLATFVSQPFSETARLINKVSHNLGANQLPLILAANEGKRTLEAGLEIERDALLAGGVQPDQVTIADGQGLPGNTISPAGVTNYLRYLTTTETFQPFYDSLAILGVDGSLASVVPPGDPATGHARGKTGTLSADAPDGKMLLQTKALAGYVDAASGKSYAFGIFVNNVLIDDVRAVLAANKDIGSIVSFLYSTL